MRQFALAVIAIIIGAGCARQAAPPPKTFANRVTVVDLTDHTAPVTNVVTDSRHIAALEALFPAYQTTPESDTAAGYIAQYVFVFELPDGSSIKVVSDGDGELWSTGSGDFPVKGNLKTTLGQLK